MRYNSSPKKRKSALCSSCRIRTCSPSVWLNFSIHKVRTNGITRLPVGAVNVNERITFVENVVLPGEKKNIFFLLPGSNICSCQSNAP